MFTFFLRPLILIFQSTPPARGATCCRRSCFPVCWYFNPRPPRGGRLFCFYSVIVSRTFQSTPPARGATPPYFYAYPGSLYFNPRPPRGGRLSLHHYLITNMLFQSTPPARGATISSSDSWGTTNISIHAPREGGDIENVIYQKPGRDFNPRPPRGGRQQRCTVLSVNL